mgnify:CR=1 FL=1
MVPFDSQAGGVARAYATGLDTLSLQLRAVVAAGQDREAAVEHCAGCRAEDLL